MKEIRWRLGEQLQARGVTAYRLARQLEKRVSRNTVYAIARGDAKGVQFDTLAAVLEALERESGKPVSLTDVLEEIEQPEQQDPLELSGGTTLQAQLEELENETSGMDVGNWLGSFDEGGTLTTNKPSGARKPLSAGAMGVDAQLEGLRAGGF